MTVQDLINRLFVCPLHAKVCLYQGHGSTHADVRVLIMERGPTVVLAYGHFPMAAKEVLPVVVDEEVCRESVRT